MKVLSIIAGKLTGFILKLINRGGAWPGKIALTIDKKLLDKLKYPKIKIAVTGSSGKGSTAALIASILRDNNYKVCFNDSGANLKYGFTSACLAYSSICGKIKADIMVMEIDEKYLKHISNSYHPDYLIVTNITKDQPPRQHHVDKTYQEIISSIEKNTTIITMMDEPYLRNFELDLANKVVYYGLDKNKYSYKKQLFENLNTYYCPKCHSKLIYSYYNFETLGRYNCKNCGFKWETPLVLGKKLDLEKEIINIEGKNIFIGGDMLFFSYNTLAAYTTVKMIGLEESKIVESINKVNTHPTYSKNETFLCDKKLYKELKVKAEDAPTWNQGILKIYQDNTKKDIIIGLHKISGRYDFKDISWLYDITFEAINNKSINNIYLLGGFKEDFKKRLILARFNPKKIILSDDLNLVREKIKKDNAKTIYGLINYDYLDTFKSVYKERD